MHNRKTMRDWMRSSRGKGGAHRTLRKTYFGGTFGKGLMMHFDRLRAAA